MRTEDMRNMIVAAGGSVDDLPDNLPSTLQKRLIETMGGECPEGNLPSDICNAFGSCGGSGGGSGVWRKIEVELAATGNGGGYGAEQAATINIEDYAAVLITPQSTNLTHNSRYCVLKGTDAGGAQVISWAEIAFTKGGNNKASMLITQDSDKTIVVPVNKTNYTDSMNAQTAFPVTADSVVTSLTVAVWATFTVADKTETLDVWVIDK